MRIYQAFVLGDMYKWKIVINNLEDKKLLTYAQKIELINYYYGYVAYQLGVKNKDEAAIYLKKGENIIEDLLKSNTTNATLYAYKGAFIGFKIGISPIKAPFLGPSSIRNVNKAINIEPNSIQANIERANILYYSPSAFGGNKTEAKEYYLKAIKLFEADRENMRNNWLYLTLMTSLAKIYTEEKNYKKAKELYEKILVVEPDFNYVKNELYPTILKKI